MNTLNVEMFNEALNYEKLQKWDEALELYDEILKEKPDHFESWLNRGALLYKKGHENEAVLSYEKALNLRKDIRALYNLGLVYYKSNRHEPALKFFQECLNIDDHFLPACILTGYLYTELNAPEKAVKILQRALQVHIENESLSISLAAAYHMMQKDDECKTILGKILKKNPENNAALKLQARISLQEAAGANTTNVIENFRNLMKHDPEFIEIEAFMEKPENSSIKANALKVKDEITKKDIKTGHDYFDLSLISFITGNGNAAMNYLLYAAKNR